MTLFSLGLIGYPVEHSLSPRLHQAALQTLGLAGEYCLYPVLPFPAGEIALQALLARVRCGELHGLNVTIPHKQTVIPFLDELTGVARAIGAVNTLYCRQGRLVGDNTDAPAFLADLESVLRTSHFVMQGSEWRALVLGAGGAARAVVYALVQAGWQVTVAARRVEQAEEVVMKCQGATICDQRSGADEQANAICLDRSAISNLKSKINLLVNATPLGMWPRVEGTPWPPGMRLPPGALVYDLVYNPAETALMRMARAAGLPAANGLGMLIEQAALAFECWTGQAASRPVMQAAVAEHGGKI